MVTDCNFRDIPESNSIEDEMQADTWYYVGEHDIFPEEFIRFLSMNDKLKDEFMKYHKDLLTSKYWRRIKNQHLKGQALLVIPYTSHLSQRKAF